MYMLRLHIELCHPSFVCWPFVGSIQLYPRWRDSISFWFVLQRVRRLIGALPGFELLQQILVRH